MVVLAGAHVAELAADVAAHRDVEVDLVQVDPLGVVRGSVAGWQRRRGVLVHLGEHATEPDRHGRGVIGHGRPTSAPTSGLLRDGPRLPRIRLPSPGAVSASAWMWPERWWISWSSGGGAPPVNWSS